MDSVNIVREDDFVECFLFFNNNILEQDKESLLSNVKQELNTLTSGHIWHKDPFNVQLITENSSSLAVSFSKDVPDHIHGLCHFGDNIEDEWLVVFLIKQITIKFPQLVAKVVDSDGEFLLIEAADYLPSWANPNNCDNRVFIKNGLLHLISEEDKSLSVKDAIEIMFNDYKDHLASFEIQTSISQRISDYPAKIKTNLHSVNVYTPVGVAEILRLKPSLVSAAVHAFCQKDSIDMKACRAMRYFPPENRVHTRVTFTRCLYAMLMHNQFNPDRRTGWNLPLANSPDYKSHSLGVKLACGFEILVSQASGDNIETTKGWKEYLQNLNKRNYFQNLIEKSKSHNELLEKAKAYYKEHLESVNIGSVVGRKVLDLLKSDDFDSHKYESNKKDHRQDDDDSWLNLDETELEKMLENRYGKKDFKSINGEIQPGQFAGKVNEFLEHLSTVEGAEFPDDKDIPVRPKRGIKKQKKEVSFEEPCESNSPPDGKIDFDPENFASAVKNILDLIIPEDNWDLDSGSEMSDYGSEDGDLQKDIANLEKINQNYNEDRVLKKYMDQMDAELSSSTLAKSFEKVKLEGDEVVDVNVNALKNIKESYKREMGGTGPAGNILGPLGYTNYDLLNSIDDDVD